MSAVIGRAPRYDVRCECCGSEAAHAVSEVDAYIDRTCDGCGACAWEWTDTRLRPAAATPDTRLTTGGRNAVV